MGPLRVPPPVPPFSHRARHVLLKTLSIGAVFALIVQLGVLSAVSRSFDVEQAVSLDAASEAARAGDGTDASAHLPCVRSGSAATGPKAAQICWIDWSDAPQANGSGSGSFHRQDVTIDVQDQNRVVTMRLPMQAHVFSYASCPDGDPALALSFGGYAGTAYPERPLARAYDTGDAQIALTGLLYSDPQRQAACSNEMTYAVLVHAGFDRLTGRWGDTVPLFRFVYGDAETHSTLKKPDGPADGGRSCTDESSTLDECTTVTIGDQGAPGSLSDGWLVGDGSARASYSGGVTWGRQGTTSLTVAGGNGDPGAVPDGDGLVDSAGAIVVVGPAPRRLDWTAYNIALEWNTLSRRGGTDEHGRLGSPGAAIGLLFDAVS